MFTPKTLVPKPERALSAVPRKFAPDDPKQRRLMVFALALLLVALGLVFYHDRDFWFPDTPDAYTDQPSLSSPVATAAPKPILDKKQPASKPRHQPAPDSKTTATKSAASAAPMVATTNRTVLPPLEVEVVAGDTHRTVHPGSNSVRVDVQPDSPPEAGSNVIAGDTTANVTNAAAERVQMSTDTSEVVVRPVRPSYPLLARQMKVQGSVILQALIGRDGIIQDLRVLSGPPILASAAQTAVRQWHFKPHYQGSDPVETQAKITVNFTISTN